MVVIATVGKRKRKREREREMETLNSAANKFRFYPLLIRESSVVHTRFQTDEATIECKEKFHVSLFPVKKGAKVLMQRCRMIHPSYK